MPRAAYGMVCKASFVPSVCMVNMVTSSLFLYNWLQAKGVDFYLPSDVVIADKFDAAANSEVVNVDAIPDGWMVSPSVPSHSQ
jgi:3-phosphoglycerate kinase